MTPIQQGLVQAFSRIGITSSRRYERSFGRVVSTERELAAAYLQMVNELANVARSVLGEQRT
jgi:hypothetical protein